jgi:hypothetical protein
MRKYLFFSFLITLWLCGRGQTVTSTEKYLKAIAADTSNATDKIVLKQLQKLLNEEVPNYHTKLFNDRSEVNSRLAELCDYLFQLKVKGKATKENLDIVLQLSNSLDNWEDLTYFQITALKLYKNVDSLIPILAEQENQVSKDARAFFAGVQYILPSQKSGFITLSIASAEKQKLHSPLKALESYLGAKALADTLNNKSLEAQIEEKIGDLYASFNDASFAKRAGAHYSKANDLYTLAGELTEAFVCELKLVKQLLSFPDTTISLVDLATKVLSDDNYTPAQAQTIERLLVQQKKQEIRNHVLGTLIRGIRSLKQHQHSDDYVYNLLFDIGTYFWYERDFRTANTYFNFAISELLGNNNYHLPFIVTLTINAACLQIYQGEVANGKELFDVIEKLAGKAKDEYLQNIVLAERGRLLASTGKPYEGIRDLYKSYAAAEESNSTYEESRLVKETLYSGLYHAYKGMNLADSVQFYLDKYNNLRASYVPIFSSLVDLESVFSEDIFEMKMHEKERQLTALMNNIQLLSAKENFLIEKISRTQNSLLEVSSLKQIADSLLLVSNDSIHYKNSVLLGLDSALVQAIFERRQVIIVSVVVFLLLGILAIGFYRFRMLRKNELLKHTRDQLTYSASAKFHNIRNSYTGFISIVDTGNYDIAKGYAEYNSNYFSEALNITEKHTWTLAEELRLLDMFYEAERLRFMDVSIKFEKSSDFDETTTEFLPEVFTTLLNNSMMYAFKKKKDNCIFTIKACQQGKLILFEVSDNGRGKSKEKYLSKSDSESGLNILHKRIETSLALARIKLPTKDRFDILVGENLVGTTVKFSFPYATL